MNRIFTALGALLLVAGAVCISLPFWIGNTPGANAFLFLGAIGVPLGLVATLYGATRPDPDTTTVRGTWGNEEENLLADRLKEQSKEHTGRRYLPSPRESVNCSKCYTLISARELTCPRCGTRRRCQECGKPLFYLSGAVRCAPCVKDEAYCDCPRPTKGRRRFVPGRARSW
ncbi:MAG TPA: hypothetical protein VGV89_05530 [Thermoplasmata archaeon]|nr:hypothetical protein [Thermoplasmata archaeon]